MDILVMSWRSVRSRELFSERASHHTRLVCLLSRRTAPSVAGSYCENDRTTRTREGNGWAENETRGKKCKKAGGLVLLCPLEDHSKERQSDGRRPTLPCAEGAGRSLVAEGKEKRRSSLSRSSLSRRESNQSCTAGASCSRFSENGVGNGSVRLRAARATRDRKKLYEDF